MRDWENHIGPGRDPVSAIDERIRVVVTEAIKIERRKAFALGLILAIASFALGVIVGLRWVPV